MEIYGERLEDAPERAFADPALKAAMACLIGRIAIRQVFPGCAGTEDPEDAVQHIPRIAPRSPASIAADSRLREERRQNGPLRVSEVHAVEYDGQHNFASQCHVGICEIGSSLTISKHVQAPCQGLSNNVRASSSSSHPAVKSLVLS